MIPQAIETFCFSIANTSLDHKMISGATVNIARERTMSRKDNESYLLSYRGDQSVCLN